MIIVSIAKDVNNTSELVEVSGSRNTIPVEGFMGEIVYNTLSAKDKKVYNAFKGLFSNLMTGSISNAPNSFYADFLILTDTVEDNLTLDYEHLPDADKKIIDDFYILISDSNRFTV